MAEIRGILTEIIFSNKDNGYIVGVIESEKAEIIIVGISVWVTNSASRVPVIWAVRMLLEKLCIATPR